MVLSPDGKRAAAERIDNSNRDIWMIDLERGLPTRFTFGALREDDPAWSPDGTYLVFSSNGYVDKTSIYFCARWQPDGGHGRGNGRRSQGRDAKGALQNHDRPWQRHRNPPS
ncbi:MAG: PD40 domain-containing protein [Acidobacteria bacterium]|nr:PD40 domain-containing protein [Acidobacteriota bacterium]